MIAQGFLLDALQVLVQGVPLLLHDVPSIMATIKRKLRAFESQMAALYSARFVLIFASIITLISIRCSLFTSVVVYFLKGKVRQSI